MPSVRSVTRFYDASHFRVWHRTDMPTLLSDVRCWVNSGKHLLAASISAFDPQRTSSEMSGPFPISDKPVRCDLLRLETVMRRREFIGLVAGATTWACGARGQQVANVRRIGVLSPFAPADTLLWNKALVRGLSDFGWVDGRISLSSIDLPRARKSVSLSWSPILSKKRSTFSSPPLRKIP